MKGGWVPCKEGLAREKWPQKHQPLDELLIILAYIVLREELKKQRDGPLGKGF